MRILIADDHAVVRRGLRQIVIDYDPSAVVQEASDGRELLALARRQDWDVAVVDITMPGGNGLDTLNDLKQLKPDMPVLILSVHSEGQYGLRALKAGAAGYLNKESAPGALVEAIQ